MRGIPFFKGKNKPQFAGLNFSDGSSGGGGSYTLPIATVSRLGGVKVGSGLAITEDGVLSSSGGGDTSSFVNKSDITPIILTGTTNTSGDVISAGTWFYLNGTPCVSKVDIASGATFTEGTNYEEKTVGSELSELNSNKAGTEVQIDHTVYVRNNPYVIPNDGYICMYEWASNPNNYIRMNLNGSNDGLLGSQVLYGNSAAYASSLFTVRKGMKVYCDAYSGNVTVGFYPTI